MEKKYRCNSKVTSRPTAWKRIVFSILELFTLFYLVFGYHICLCMRTCMPQCICGDQKTSDVHSCFLPCLRQSLLKFFIITFICLLVSVWCVHRVHMCVHKCALAQMGRSKDNLEESALSFTMWVPGSQTQVIGLSGKCLDMLAYLVRLLNSVSLLYFGHMLS